MINNLTHSIYKVSTVSPVHLPESLYQHPCYHLERLNLEQYNSNKVWEKAKSMR